MIRQLRNRAQQIENTDALSGILDGIPEHPCHTESHFLEGNDDFFIASILKSSQDEGMHCQRLIRHLNDCFLCFETYGEVMSDFLNEYHGQRRQGDNNE